MINYSQIVSVLVSSYTLMAISVERYIGIFFPFRPKMTLRQVLMVVFSTWILSFGISLPAVIFSEIVEQPISDRASVKQCAEKWPENDETGAYSYSYMYGIILMVLQVSPTCQLSKTCLCGSASDQFFC